MQGSESQDLFGHDFIPTSDEDWLLLDARAQQLFRPTAPIDEQRLFVGRINQIGQLLEVIYQAGAHAIVYGERGVGKTSLANILDQKVIGDSTTIKALKITCTRGDTFGSVWRNVFFDFEHEGRSMSDVLGTDPQPFAVYKVAQGLPQRTQFLVILDEFDRLEGDEIKVMMADTIKYFSDNPINVTILVVGVGGSVEALFGKHPSIQRCCTQIRMPRMKPSELRPIFTERLAKLHMTAENEVIDNIVKLSQGLPGYTHLLGMLAVRAALAEQSKRVQLKHLDLAVASALDKSDESTRRDYYKAIQSTKPDNKYKEVLLACAMTEKNALGQFSATAVCEPYSRIVGKDVGIEHFARHLNAFCQQDRGPVLVKVGKPKRFLYHFHNPLLEPLVMLLRKP